jgi:ABC-type glycerol-3-phosphate transport system permease component
VLGRHRQPAGDEGRARRRAGALSVEVSDAWQKLNEADGVIPYLDYTTPTFGDDLGGAIQELLGRQAGPGGVHQGRAGGLRQVGGVPLRLWRGSPDDRPPGEPRLVGYLYLLPGVRGLQRVRPVPALPGGLHLVLRLGRLTGRDVDRAWSNYKAVFTDPELRSAFAHALVLLIFYAVLPVLIGLLLAGLMARARIRGWRSSGRSCSCRR